jgi:hypothetical protein
MNDKKINLIYNHFGKESQIEKTIEEIAEFELELLNSFKLRESEYSVKSRTNIIQEMADIIIMLRQMQLAFDITDNELNEQIEYKLDRTIERIGSGYYGNI